MAKGDDARVRNQINQQQQRYQGQQGAFVDQAGYNYGYGSGANTADYTDIMNRYRGLAGIEGGTGGGGSGGGMKASLIGYKDPFASYGGYQDFSQSGGYSPEDIANMRARAISPTRSIYANALQNMQRQRVLQGGYSPNFMAASAKMAREMSQEISDRNQAVGADLASMIQQGRLAGLGGMAGIEGQRLGADLDVAKFNAQAKMAASRAAGAAGAQNTANQLAALRGMTSLYGTTPAMSELFGNQLLSGIGQGGQMGMGYIGAQQNAATLPGDWDYAMSRAGQIGDILYPQME